MATLKNSAQRVALAGSFALAVAAAPLMAAFAVPSIGSAVAECPAGQLANPENGACEVQPEATPPGDISYSTPGDANSLPEVQGIPCTGANTGQCIGLQEEQQAPVAEPHSTISSSP
ncbi:intersectin-EH binding protein Ibp1 [Mycolicibacterium sp. CBM1]